jgi:hypothetical protein
MDTNILEELSTTNSDLEDVGSRFLQNVGTNIPDNIASNIVCIHHGENLKSQTLFVYFISIKVNHMNLLLAGTCGKLTL